MSKVALFIQKEEMRLGIVT